MFKSNPLSNDKRGFQMRHKSEQTTVLSGRTNEMKPETSEQIAVYGIKLHLNVHIFSVKRRTTRRISLFAKCSANELFMFGCMKSVSIHRKKLVALFLTASSPASRWTLHWILIFPRRFTLQSHLTVETSQEEARRESWQLWLLMEEKMLLKKMVFIKAGKPFVLALSKWCISEIRSIKVYNEISVEEENLCRR